MFHDAISRSVRRSPRWLVAALLLTWMFIGGSLAQVSTAVNTEEDDDFAGGAALKTDPELEQLLKKADEFAGDGRHDLACVLWQRVLDESTGTVMTRKEWTTKTFKRMYRRYRSVAGEIEQTIAKPRRFCPKARATAWRSRSPK